VGRGLFGPVPADLVGVRCSPVCAVTTVQPRADLHACHSGSASVSGDGGGTGMVPGCGQGHPPTGKITAFKEEIAKEAA